MSNYSVTEPSYLHKYTCIFNSTYHLFCMAYTKFTRFLGFFIECCMYGMMNVPTLPCKDKKVLATS